MKWFGKRKNKRSTSADGRHGSTSNDQQRVISYYTASRRQLDNFERTSSSRDDAIHNTRRFRLKESWFSIVAGIVIIAAVIYLATLNATPQVTIQGQTYRSIQEYQEAVASVFNGSIQNKFKPTLQSTSLEAAIRQKLPEASQVTVSSSLLGHRPEVLIVTDTPLAVFTQPGSTDYVLSDRGRLLLPSSSTTFAVKDLPLLQNQTGVKGEAGQQFMRPDEATAFSRLIYQFSQDNSKPIYTLALTPHELLARESGRGLSYDERFLLNEDITLQYGALRATQTKLQSLGQTPAQYVDVRLIEKVFYQ